MKRDASLIRLSRDHHRGLVLAMRIERDLPNAAQGETEMIYSQLQSFWQDGLLHHFRAECECLLTRLVRHVAPQDEIIATTQQDHLQMESLIVSMRDTEDWQARRGLMFELGTFLKKHIRWEESVLFDAAQRLLDAEEKSILEADLAERIPEIPPPPSWPTG
jgi:hemerythrin-like domain-containing protein